MPTSPGVGNEPFWDSLKGNQIGDGFSRGHSTSHSLPREPARLFRGSSFESSCNVLKIGTPFWMEPKGTPKGNRLPGDFEKRPGRWPKVCRGRSPTSWTGHHATRHVCQARLLERGKTSGRADDNLERLCGLGWYSPFLTQCSTKICRV